MAGALEHLDQLAERDVLLHRDDVGARHHDVVDPAPAQRQDVGEHGALLRREAGSRRARRSPAPSADVRARRAGLPAEQRAQHAREPAVAGSRRRGAGCGTGAAGSRVRSAALWLGCDLARRCRAWRVGRSGVRCELRVRRYGSGTPSRARIARSSCSIVSASRVGLVIVAQQVEKSMHGEMGEMMVERLALGRGLARDGLVGDRDVAERFAAPAPRLPARPETTARWSACRCRASAR